jgi:hypothetical protein
VAVALGGDGILPLSRRPAAGAAVASSADAAPERRGLSISVAVGVLVVAVGFIAGGRQLFDNSFLTHLSTGRLIWDGQGFPHEDPYTFTAAGESWAVQSWFASVIYGGVEELADLEGLRVHFALVAGVLAGLGWLLTRAAGDVLRRTAAIVPFLAAAAFGWSHRPYVIGLICLALVLLAAERRIDPRWLVPVGWLWLNTHGGWPLGLAALAALWLGRRLDGEDGAAERRAASWLAAGLAVGCLNPYGVRLLLFPFVAVERQEAFRRILEWQAPTFTSRDELAFLVVVAAAVLALRLAPSWHRALPLAGFLCAALLSSRNVQVAALVLLPGTAEGLRALGRTRPTSGDDFAALARPVAAIGAALGAVTLVTAAIGDPFGDEPYPVEASDFLEARGLDPTQATVVAMDYIGNYWEARYGTDARVFVDDRVEVLPLDVLDDYATLEAGGPGWDEALERYDPVAVVWEAERPLAQLLRASDGWEIAHEDDKFVVALRAGND